MRRHAFPVVMLLITLLFTRQLYPYVSGSEPMVDGYVVDEVASGLGGPTCLVWSDETTLLVCDRDGEQILSLNLLTDERTSVLSGLDRPHGLALDGQTAYVSEAGALSSYTVEEDGTF